MNVVASKRRMSVFTAIVLGISAIVITCVVSASSIAVYGMYIIDQKTDTLVGAVQTLVEELPALHAALPPTLADAIRDERRPDYRDQLRIKVDVQPHPEHSRYTTTSISVVNEGDEVVSLLALRVVALDEKGRPRSATTEYVATPLAIDNDWRGPLLPGSTRQTTTTHYGSHQVDAVEYEVTELRLWLPETGATPSAKLMAKPVETTELAANTGE